MNAIEIIVSPEPLRLELMREGIHAVLADQNEVFPGSRRQLSPVSTRGGPSYYLALYRRSSSADIEVLAAQIAERLALVPWWQVRTHHCQHPGVGICGPWLTVAGFGELPEELT